MDFRELFRDVRRRRGMFVMDDRYVTVLAFIDGCDAATGGRLLRDFGDWVSWRLAGKNSPIAWGVQIAEKHGFQAREDGSKERVEAAIEDVFIMLDEFLGENCSDIEVSID